MTFGRDEFPQPRLLDELEAEIERAITPRFARWQIAGCIVVIATLCWFWYEVGRWSR